MHAHPTSKIRRALTAVSLTALCAASAALTTVVVRPSTTAPAAAIAVDSSTFAPPSQALESAAPPPAAAPPLAAPPALVSAVGSCVQVPILVYHYIRINTNPADHLGYELSVTPNEFREQMDWLRQAGGHPITFAQLFDALRGAHALPSRPVLLTFDDGYDNFATVAAPDLAHEGFVATAYVVSGFIGRPYYMSAAQVRQVASMGMVIGAHTVHHLRLTALPPQAAAIEIKASKLALEQLLGRPVSDFAYPYGSWSPALAAMVAQDGFNDATTLDYGATQCLAQAFSMRRIRVTGDDTVWSFAAKAGVAAPPVNWVDAQLRAFLSSAPSAPYTRAR
ncbi:MAG: polysaccharide deacetylase family protein [Candidatus Dormibacteraeota bacterium]|nr:polysaccharide deacetylase family protein [Candidatus Dormibacteraeota bacterium]MBV9525440.1 polysaccharide deacetylase family protein [Candidatus Dormibacteraeota bacterium]